MIRVFLADDERLIRQGFRKLLELDGAIDVVGEAADGAEALALVPAASPDVVLLDVRMPRVSGLDVLERLGDGRPPTLVLTTFDDAELLLRAVRAGARGFLNKDVSLDELVAAIRALARGDTWFQPALTASLRRGIEGARAEGAGAARPHDRAAPAERLTDRERDVLRLMAGGYSNREIADVLDTAEGTVKNQVSSILGKLGVRDRTRAVLKAIETGVI
jgi:DNA-binding NarL/FixJ family response regulator